MAEDIAIAEEDSSKKVTSSSSSRSASYSPSAPRSQRSGDGDSVNSRKSSSSPYSSRRKRKSPSSPRIKDRQDAVSVEISGLTRTVTELHLSHIFGQYGTIVDIILPISRSTGENKGKAWVVYRSASNAEKAEEYMSGGQIDGVIISAQQSHIREEDRRQYSRRSYDESKGSRGYDRSRRDNLGHTRRYDER